MAELASLSQPGASIGDTFNGLVIIAVINASEGLYLWRDDTVTVADRAATQANTDSINALTTIVDTLETKSDLIGVTQPVDLDALAADVTALETKTDLITVALPVNLDLLQQSIDTDISAIQDKTNLITVTEAINLDTLRDDVDDLQSSGASVNLSYTGTESQGTIINSAGADAILPQVSDVQAGLMLPGHKIKLDGIATGATANSTDTSLRDRATHTGTQTASTISDLTAAIAAQAPVTSVAGRTGAISLAKGDVGLANVDNTADTDKPISTATQAALNAKQASLGFTPENVANKGVANGYAALGSDGKIPSAQLPADGSYQGTWNANTNTPAITSGVGTSGDFYFVATAGSTTVDGISSWVIGDQVRFNGTAWEKIPSSAAVSSVAGKTGAVTLEAADVGLGNVTNVAQAPASRTITAGTGLTGGGDLSANRTLGVSFGSTSGTVCQGNDSRLSDARTPTAHTHTAANITDFNSAAAAAAPVQTVAGKSGAVSLVVGDVSGAAPIASPTLTGTPVAPTPASGDDSTRIATTAFVKAQGFATSSGVTSVSGTAPIAASAGTTPVISISPATTGAAGSMSAADKTKLDRVTITSPQNIDTIASNASAALTKTNHLTVTQAVDLDTMETDVAASKTKTSLLAVTLATDLDTIRTKVGYLTVTQAVNLDTMESDLSTATGKTSLITINTPVNLNNLQTTFGYLTVTSATNLDTIRTKSNHLTVTSATDLDAIRTKAAHLTVTAATNLDTIRTKTNHLTVTQAVDLDAVEAAANEVAGLIALRGRTINIEDYGAVSGMLPDTPEGKTQALANADAIINAYLAAANSWEGFPGFSPNGADEKLGGSIYRYLGARIVFPGSIYQIAKPIALPYQSGFIYWDGNNSAIARYGDEGEFDADYPGRWAIEFGQDHTDVSVFTGLLMEKQLLAGFTYGMRLGLPPNNVNMGFIKLVDCEWVGPDGMHPGTIGVRVFNRSASLILDRCMANCYDRSLEIQSCDRVTITNGFRIQIGNQNFASGITRPANEAQIIINHARVKVGNAIFNPPLINGGIPNLATQRHFWFWQKEFNAWEANKKYLQGDCIYQAYETGADPVYWARLNYTADSGATWAADRANWQVIDSMAEFLETTGETGMQPGDIRRAKQTEANGGDGVWRFYRWIGAANGSYSATGAGMFVVTANWEAVPPSGDEVTTVGTQHPWENEREAGQPISAWNHLEIDEDTIFGGETGGLTPVLWDWPKIPYNYRGGTRKAPSFLRLANSTCNTAVGYSAGGEQPTNFIPAVLLREIPNHLIIEDNEWSTVPGACAAMWDPTLAVLPEVPITNSSNWPSPFRCKIKGNMLGSFGLASWANARPNASYGWYFYGPNWAPPELIAPILNSERSTGVKTLGTITAGSGYTNGTYDNKQATYVSGATATTYPKFNVTVVGGVVTAVTVADKGKGFFATGTVLTVPAADLGGTGSGFSIPVTAIDFQDYSAWAASTAVENGELRRIDAESKIYRSRFTRTTGSTWDATEQAFWSEATDLVDDQLVGGPYINCYVGNSEVYRWANPQRNVISGLLQLEPGRIVTILFQSGGSQVTHNASILKLKSGTSVTNVAAGSVMAFTSLNGVGIEVYRNF